MTERVPEVQESDSRSCWMVERQAFGGNYWDSIVFGPFPSREEAERFADGPYGGHPYDASRAVPVEPDLR